MRTLYLHTMRRPLLCFAASILYALMVDVNEATPLRGLRIHVFETVASGPLNHIR